MIDYKKKYIKYKNKYIQLRGNQEFMLAANEAAECKSSSEGANEAASGMEQPQQVLETSSSEGANEADIEKATQNTQSTQQQQQSAEEAHKQWIGLQT